MRVDWAILCRYIEVSESGLVTIVGGGIDVYTLPHLPIELPITAAVRFLSLPDNQPHVIDVFVLDPSLQRVGVGIEPFPLVCPPGPMHPAGWEVSLPLRLVLRVPLDQVGTHSLEITVDGAASRAVPFQVMTPT